MGPWDCVPGQWQLSLQEESLHGSGGVRGPLVPFLRPVPWGFPPKRAMPKITFEATGEVHEVPAGTSMIEHCQANDAGVPFGCTVGVCGTCAVLVSSGGENVSAALEDEVETLEGLTDRSGARLACRMTIEGDVTVIPLGDAS